MTKHQKNISKAFEAHGICETQIFDCPDAAFEYLHLLYNQAVEGLQYGFQQALDGQIDHIDVQNSCYPFIGIEVESHNISNEFSYSYGAVCEPGLYGGTVTRPDLFKDYLLEQMGLLINNHNIPIVVGRSNWPIPLPFAVDHSPADLEQDVLWQVKNAFVLPNLSRLNDHGPNCTNVLQTAIRPISLFSGERIDFSLHRLHHYTGTKPDHFQSFILLTNYQRYMDSFIRFGINELNKEDTEYTEFIGPGGLHLMPENLNEVSKDLCPTRHTKYLPQMPAYHLKRKDGQGITFINIGVGPSNAKTITDHLAVLRPHCWIMLGHCAGLRSTQKLGDYVLAHGYVREDHVLDSDLPLWVPVPALAEVQVALQQAVHNVTCGNKAELKLRMRTGTVLTTDNRNWELQSKELYERFRQSRAIAVDMESATVTANGFRFRVPYGTLLCVSDKPIHGEIKLQGIANTFYRQRVDQHLEIGLETIKLLRLKGMEQLHSRKLRGFDEPPFR